MSASGDLPGNNEMSEEVLPDPKSMVNLPKPSSDSDVINDDGYGVDVDQETEDVGVMIGVEIFEESDLVTDTDNKLQLYSDVDVDAGGESDALLLNDHLQGPSSQSQSQPGTVPAIITDPKLLSKKTKVFKEPSRLSLEERIKCIRMCSRYKSYADAQKAWKQKYGTDPPCRKTLSTLDKKFQKTGSVADLTRTGRPKTARTDEVIARVEDAVRKDPSKSIRTLSKELGICQASVHRIRKAFEDKRSTLKMENKKLRDNLNDALKRIVILERRLTRSLYNEEKAENSVGVETLVFTAPSGENTGVGVGGNLEIQSGSNPPTIIALNSANGQVSLPSVLRLQQPGQETIHIITLPQGSSHHLLSLDDSNAVQLSMGNEQDLNGTTAQLMQTSNTNLVPVTFPGSQEGTTSYVLSSNSSSIT